LRVARPSAERLSEVGTVPMHAPVLSDGTERFPRAVLGLDCYEWGPGRPCVARSLARSSGVLIIGVVRIRHNIINIETGKKKATVVDATLEPRLLRPEIPSPTREVMLYILGGEKKTTGRGSSTCVAGSKSNCVGVWGATLFVCSHLPRTVHMHTTLDRTRAIYQKETRHQPFCFPLFSKRANAHALPWHPHARGWSHQLLPAVRPAMLAPTRRRHRRKHRRDVRRAGRVQRAYHHVMTSFSPPPSPILFPGARARFLCAPATLKVASPPSQLVFMLF